SRPAGPNAPIAGPNTRSRPRCARCLIGPIGLLFDDSRPELHVDALLDGGMLVIEDVDRARELDEVAVEGLQGLLVADSVFDIPEPLVHLVQGALVRSNVALRAAAVLPGLFQQRQLQAHVGDLGDILDPGSLDAQDGDLVQQLTRGDGNQYVVHGSDRNNSSSCAVTCCTSMSSITP